MANHSQRVNVFILNDEEGFPKALILNRTVFSLTLLNDEEIAELFNGGVLPIVPAVMKKNASEEDVGVNRV